MRRQIACLVVVLAMALVGCSDPEVADDTTASDPVEDGGAPPETDEGAATDREPEPEPQPEPAPEPDPEPDPDPDPDPDPEPEPEPEPSTRPYRPLPDDLRLAREQVVETPEQITALATRPEDDRIFAGDKLGRVWVVEDDDLGERPFLDLADQVHGASQMEEQGLLSIVFHPDPDDGRFFAYYVTADGDDSRLSAFEVSDDGSTTLSHRVVLDIEQPFRWHNGGQLVFGPDGMLWLSLGDGGLSGDPDLHAQDPTNHLGAILRIDVDDPSDGQTYGIPPDNPFADGEEGAPEVWAYGLRNPWRMAIDPVEWTVYVADVGQHRYEWLNIVDHDEAGANFGWPVVEGSTCYPEHADRCPGEGFTDPAVEYTRDGGACAVIGGEVYDGSAIPELAGHYVYGDLCAGFVRSFRYVDGEPRDERDWTDQLGAFETMVTFGADPDGELLVSDQQGAIWRIVPET